MLKWIHGGISAVTGIAEPEYGEDYIHSATKRVKDNKQQPFVELTREDLHWLNPEYTNVETLTFYFSDHNSGILGFAQIIHSSIVGLHTQAQCTFRAYDSNNPESLNFWTSTKLENFRVEGPNFFADKLSIELNEENNEYHFKSDANERSSFDLYFKRLTPGVKIGENSTTYYGNIIEEPWGSMRHIFWPRNHVRGTINIKKPVKKEASEEEEQKGEEEEANDDEEEEQLEDQHIEFTEDSPAYSLVIMAFQGMKPHHAAKSWNFLNFHSKDNSAILIEFTTPKSYANTKVSMAIVTSDTEILAVTTDNEYKHLNNEVDSVGWSIPKNISINLKGVSAKVTDEEIANDTVKDEDKFKAIIEGPLNHLVERVDVMNEIPQFVKSIVSGVAGTKPYIYQFADNEKFTLQINDGKKITGLGWAEVTFIAESNVTEEVQEE